MSRLPAVLFLSSALAFSLLGTACSAAEESTTASDDLISADAEMANPAVGEVRAKTAAIGREWNDRAATNGGEVMIDARGYRVSGETNRFTWVRFADRVMTYFLEKNGVKLVDVPEGSMDAKGIWIDRGRPEYHRELARAIVVDAFGEAESDGEKVLAVETQVRELLELLGSTDVTESLSFARVSGKTRVEGDALRKVTLYLFRANIDHSDANQYIAFFVREGRGQD